MNLQAELYMDGYPTQFSQRNLDADEFFEPASRSAYPAGA